MARDLLTVTCAPNFEDRHMNLAVKIYKRHIHPGDGIKPQVMVTENIDVQTIALIGDQKTCACETILQVCWPEYCDADRRREDPQLGKDFYVA